MIFNYLKVTIFFKSLILNFIYPNNQMAPKKKAEGDAAKGEKIFKSQCTVCHAVASHGTGPMLKGTFGS